MDYILSLIANSDKLPWVLTVIAGLITAVLHQAQKADNNFDLKEMLIDPETKMVSVTRMGNFIALVITSWGFVYLILHDKLTEMYFSGYLLTWTGANILSKGIAAYSSKKVDKTAEKSDTPDTKGK